MRPIPLIVAGAAVTAGVVAVAAWQMPRQVKLPVHEGQVTFFEEGKQAILVGNPPAGVKNLSAEACASCHKEEHSQWKSSAHSRSVTEPVFAAAFKSEQRFLCRSCHSPLSEQQPMLLTKLDKAPKTLLNGELLSQVHAQGANGMPAPFLTEKNPLFEPGLATEGITCVTCHVREGTVLTANPTGSNKAPHGLAYAPIMKKAEFCGGCHQFDINNPQVHPFEPKTPGQKVKTPAVNLARAQRGLNRAMLVSNPDGEDPPVPPSPGLEQQYQMEPRVQGTLDEFRISPAAARGETCQSCHMPSTKDTAGHVWPGRNDTEMLRKAVDLAVKLDRKEYAPGEKIQAVIKLTNQGGHRFPTGDSVHAGILDVWLKDGEKTLGRQTFVMTNQGGINQFFQSGQVIQFESGFRSLNGIQAVRDLGKLDKPTRQDTRLLPGEEATLVYSQKVAGELAKAKNPTLKVRVFHAAIHPGFQGSSIDPKLGPPKLFREQIIPLGIKRSVEPAVEQATRPVRNAPRS